MWLFALGLVYFYKVYFYILNFMCSSRAFFYGNVFDGIYIISIKVTYKKYYRLVIVKSLEIII